MRRPSRDVVAPAAKCAGEQFVIRQTETPFWNVYVIDGCIDNGGEARIDNDVLFHWKYLLSVSLAHVIPKVQEIDGSSPLIGSFVVTAAPRCATPVLSAEVVIAIPLITNDATTISRV